MTHLGKRGAGKEEEKERVIYEVNKDCEWVQGGGVTGWWCTKEHLVLRASDDSFASSANSRMTNSCL